MPPISNSLLTTRRPVWPHYPTQAPWLYLIETDFVFLRPVATPGRAEDPAVRGLAFRYGNISPNAKVLEVGRRKRRRACQGPCRRRSAVSLLLGEHCCMQTTLLPSWPALQPTLPVAAPGLQPLMRRLYPPGYGPLTDLPPTGPSPVLMRVADWVRVAPRWEGYTAQVRRNRGQRGACQGAAGN